MRKIKLLIASMIGAIALVFACVVGISVNAGKNVLYDASTETTEAKNKIHDGGYELSTDTGILSISSSDSVYANVFDFDGYERSTRVNSNGSAFNFTAKKNIEFTVVYAFTDSSKAYAVAYTAKIDGEDYETGTSSNSKVNTITVKLEANQVLSISSSARRCAIFEVYYTTVDAITDEDAETDYGYIESYNIDVSKLTGTEKDQDNNYSQATADDLKNFYVPYGTNGSGKINKMVNTAPTVFALQSSGPNYGLKFTTTKEASLVLKLASTGNSNVSIFELVELDEDNNITSILVANEDSTLVTNTEAGAAGVYEITGQSETAVSYNLGAGTYFMQYISGKTNAGSGISRGGRWLDIKLSYPSTATTLNAKLQRQVSTDKDAIRFIATLEGFDATKISKIDSLTYTIKVTGYKAFTKEVTSVYTSVKSGNVVILSEKENTYYCSYMFTGLLSNDGALVGKNIQAYLTIVIDGTTITTNSVGYNIVAA